MLDVLLKDSVLDSVVQDVNDSSNPHKARVQEAPLEIFLPVLSGPQNALVEFRELLGCLGIQLVEYWLVQWVYLQRCQLKVRVG